MQNIPKVFEFSTQVLPVPHPLPAPGPPPAQEELLQAPTRGAFVPESKVTTT